MKILTGLVLISLITKHVTSLTYPTVVEAELGKSYIMRFTFDRSTSNLSQFHIYNDTSTTAMVSIVDNTTSVYRTWEGRANVEDNIATGTVTVTLTSVLVGDEGWYRVTMDTGYSEQSGRFPIVTYAQPIYLTITQTVTPNRNERHIRCTGNVGRPHPVLRLLQSPPYNDVTDHEIIKYTPTSPLQNGTFMVDQSFNVTFPFSDNGTYVVCDVTHAIALGKQLRPIRSALELIIVEQPAVSGQSTITITGTSTLVTPTSELRITCQPSSVGITDINSISVQKNTSNAAYATLVSVSYSKASSSSVFSWPTAGVQNRQGVSATGNVDKVSDARLVFTIAVNYTSCTDAGVYKCLMGVTLTGGSGGLAEAEKYVAATVKPTYTNALYVTPPNVDNGFYSVGTVLTFSCSGTVGSAKEIHTWCYKRSGDSISTGYTGYPVVADIDQNEAGLVQDGCNYRRSSTLTYNVTSADTNTTFMCEPFTGGMCGTSAVGLKSYKSIKGYISGGNTGGQDDTPSASSAGTIAGIVIGVFAGILLIILIVYFVVFRRSSPGETYSTKEDGSPEGPAHTEGPVYSVPDKNRTRGQYMKVNRSSFRDISFSYSPERPTAITPASPPGQPPSPPREYESLAEVKRELHYADLDIASRPPGVPAPRLSKHTPTEYATVKFV